MLLADSGAAVSKVQFVLIVCPLFLWRQKAQRKSSQKERLKREISPSAEGDKAPPLTRNLLKKVDQNFNKIRSLVKNTLENHDSRVFL